MRQQILALTSLRLFACLLAAAAHVTDQLKGWIYEVPFYQSVTFFFVLSGFILTYSYPELPRWIDIKAFWVARFARIWPAYFVSFLLSMALVPAEFVDYSSAKGMLQVSLGILALQSWVPFPDYYFTVNPVGWTISTEAFFYLCFPWLIRNLDRTWISKLALCSVGGIAACLTIMMLHLPTYASNIHELDADALIYVSPVTKVLEFMIGMAAASIYRQYEWVQIKRFGLATILESAIVIAIVAQCFLGPAWYEWYSPFYGVLSNGVILWIERSGSAPLYALLLVVFAQEAGAISRHLRGRFWVLGGELSFALYLLHQIWLHWMRAHAALTYALPTWIYWSVYGVATLATSYAVWAFVETPCRKRITTWYRGLAAADARIPGTVHHDQKPEVR